LKELHRVLKSTGSIYLHCDPTASHYLKLLMDAIFGIERYLSEWLSSEHTLVNDASFGCVASTDFRATPPAVDKVEVQ
jgi:hypothetical protein